MMAGLIDAILGVFTSIGTWIAGAFNQLVPVFWTAGSGSTPGELTFMGVLAVAGLGISVIFLILGIVQKFLKFGA